MALLSGYASTSSDWIAGAPIGEVKSEIEKPKDRAYNAQEQASE
jgi:hypothetical protein